MNLENSLKNIICISLIFSGFTFGQIIFTPFKNNASYKGTWELSKEVPNYIAAYMREFHDKQVLSSTALISLAEKRSDHKEMYGDLEFISEIASEYGFKYAATGKINNFEISRFTAGDPLVAGYEAYSCKIDVDIQIYDLSANTSLFSGRIIGDISDKGLGLSLLGKPTEEKQQFLALNDIRFGSEEFNSTIVGEAMFQMCEMLTEELRIKIKDFLNKSDKKIIKEISDKSLEDIELNTEIKKGQILTYDEQTGEAFINLGSSNGISIGEELAVYSAADSLFDPSSNEFLGLSDKKVSVLEIIEVRGEKLSLAVIKKNRNDVEVGMEIRKLVLKRREE